jgi:hypothetical protein
LQYFPQALCQTLQKQERETAYANFDNASKAALLALKNLSKAAKPQCPRRYLE